MKSLATLAAENGWRRGIKWPCFVKKSTTTSTRLKGDNLQRNPLIQPATLSWVPIMAGATQEDGSDPVWLADRRYRHEQTEAPQISCPARRTISSSSCNSPEIHRVRHTTELHMKPHEKFYGTMLLPHDSTNHAYTPHGSWGPAIWRKPFAAKGYEGVVQTTVSNRADL